MLDFTVKSIVHDYEVKFIDDIKLTLQEEVLEDDVMIIDSKLLDHYPDILALVSGNSIIPIEATEKNKSYEGLEPVIRKLIDGGFRKNHRLVGIGGGIIQDITSFISSVMYRGVEWIFFPTTLLAQGDSCIGSKTSINFQGYKNQLGGFYPPNQIFIDLHILNSLPKSDLQSGFGEMSHYFVIAGEEDFNRFKMNYASAWTDKSVLAQTVARSLEIKKSYIEIDEYDRNERQIFNYGHSFGHAIESLTDYHVPHGIAVSIGMDMANFISAKMGILDPDVRTEIRDFLKQIWIGYDIRHLDVKEFSSALAKDKKNVGKELRLILCRGLGSVHKMAVKNDDVLQGWLADYLKNEA